MPAAPHDAPGAQLLDRVRPSLGLLLDRLWATAETCPAIDDDLRAAVRRVVADADGIVDPGAAPASAVDRSAPALRFAEQFAVDVAGIGDEHRAGLGTALGPDAFTGAQVVWTFDVIGRTRAVLGALAGDDGTASPTGWRADATPTAPFDDLWTGIQALLDAVPGLQALDPVTTDLARLRLAGHHRCRLCRSLRSYAALEAGADDERYLAVDRDDAPRSAAERAALDLVDAFAWTPGAIPADVLDAVRASWSEAQQVELVLDAARNAANKLAVAFGADAPHVEEGYEVYDVAADGTVTYGLAAPPSS